MGRPETRKEKKDLYEKIEAAIRADDTLNIEEACQKYGLPRTTFNYYRLRFREESNKKKESKMLTFPMPEDDQVVILIGKSSVIAAALEKVKR